MRRRLALLGAVLGLLSRTPPAMAAAPPAETQRRLALAAQEQTPGAPFIGAAYQRGVYVPGGTGYVPPVLTNNYDLAYGDSRAANGGGVVYGGTGFTVSHAFGNGWSGELGWLSNNVLLFERDWNYGVGASSSAGIAARQSIAGNACNDGAASLLAPCWLNGGGVRTTTVGTTSAGSSSFTVASTAGLTNGMEAVILAPAGVFAAHTTIMVSGTTVSLSTPTLVTMNSGTSVTFSPIANTAPFWNFLDGTQLGFTATDYDLNKSGAGSASVLTDPANLVFFLTGTNDGSIPIAQSLKNIGGIFDAFGPTQANKLVIAGDEVPRGLATAISEIHIPVAGSFTVAPLGGAIASNYFADVALIYAPATVNNAAGANDGVRLTNDGPGCVQGSLATGHYCVNTSTGVDTTSTGDNGVQMESIYTWKAGGGPGSSLLTIHDWLDSATCNDFTDPISLVTYAGIKGAQCNRPWLVVVPTWAAEVDASTGANFFPLPYYSQDNAGLHPLPGAGIKLAKVWIAAATPYVGSTPQFTIPAATLNNPQFTGASSSSTSAQTTTCTGANLTKNYFMTSLTPAASMGLYAIGMKVYAVSNMGVPAGTAVDCVDTANNQIHLAAPATTTFGASIAFGQIDTTSLLLDGLFSHLDVPATPPTIASCNAHCGTPTGATQTVPSGWTLSLSAGDTTALNAGTFAFGYGVETNPLSDGYDDMVFTLQGVSGASGGMTLQENLTAAQLAALTMPGDKYRGLCRVTLDKGPNGQLWGIIGLPVKAQATTTGTFTAPGATTNTYTVYAGSNGAQATAQEFVTQDVGGGPLVMPLLTDIVDTTLLPNISAVNFSFQILYTANTPVSATVRISGCTLEKVIR